MMRAAKMMPSRCRRPGRTRLALAPGLSSLGSRPRALSTMARKVDFEIFQPMGLPFLVQLATRHGETLPELAPGMGAIDHGEFAIEHARIAGLRCLQKPRVHPLGSRRSRRRGEWSGALWQRCRRGSVRRWGPSAAGRRSRSSHDMCPFRIRRRRRDGRWCGRHAGEQRAESGGSVISRRPERSLAGRPQGLPDLQTRAMFGGGISQHPATFGVAREQLHRHHLVHDARQFPPGFAAFHLRLPGDVRNRR